MFRRENNIDAKVKRKRELVIKRDKLQRDMRERNSKRENKITILENASLNDYENTNKKVVKINRQLEKLLRDIESEQIYVNEVATAEKEEYLKDQKTEMAKKQMKR